MGTSSDGSFEALASRTARATSMARWGTVLAFVLPTLVAGGIVWNGALRLTKLDARMKLERHRTLQVIDSLRREIDLARAGSGNVPSNPHFSDAPRRGGDTVRMRDTMRVGDTVRIRSTDTIRIRTIDTMQVGRLRAEIARLQQTAARADAASAACAKSVRTLQDSVARLNAIIKRLQGGARPPLDLRRNQ